MPPNAHPAPIPALSVRHSIRMAQARQAGTLTAVSRTGVAQIADDTPAPDAVEAVAQLAQQLHDTVIDGTGQARLTPVTFLHLHGQEAIDWMATARTGPDLAVPAVTARDEEMAAVLRASGRAVLVSATVLVDSRRMPKGGR